MRASFSISPPGTGRSGSPSKGQKRASEEKRCPQRSQPRREGGSASSMLRVDPSRSLTCGEVNPYQPPLGAAVPQLEQNLPFTSVPQPVQKRFGGAMSGLPHS